MKNEAKATETGAAKQPRPVCEIPDCESPARYRGTCSPEHYQERALHRQAAVRGVSHDRPRQVQEAAVAGGIHVEEVRAFLAEIVEALDVPDSATLDDWEKARRLVMDRAAFVSGWVKASLTLSDEQLLLPGLAKAAVKDLPVKYEPLAKDGES